MTHGNIGRPPLPLGERVGVRGRATSCVPALDRANVSDLRDPSSACRHLLPQGEKGGCGTVPDLVE